MSAYDVPDVGQVTVTFSTHRFGLSDQTLRTLDSVRDAGGREVPYEVWEKVNQHLRAIGVVN